MDELSKIHVGLDVHKDSISIGVAEPGRGPARVVGKIAHDVGKLTKLLSRIGPPAQLHLVYEAGLTGYGLQRSLAARDYLCEVIAPAQMPRRPGDRVKSDGRDCVQLAECSRAGQLRAVWIPAPGDEAIRDLSRAREDAVNSRTQGATSAQGFLASPRPAFCGQDLLDQGLPRLAGLLELRCAAGANGIHRVLAGRAGSRCACPAPDPGGVQFGQRLALRARGQIVTGTARRGCCRRRWPDRRNWRSQSL